MTERKKLTAYKKGKPDTANRSDLHVIEDIMNKNCPKLKKDIALKFKELREHEARQNKTTHRCTTATLLKANNRG